MPQIWPLNSLLFVTRLNGSFIVTKSRQRKTEIFINSRLRVFDWTPYFSQIIGLKIDWRIRKSCNQSPPKKIVVSPAHTFDECDISRHFISRCTCNLEIFGLYFTNTTTTHKSKLSLAIHFFTFLRFFFQISAHERKTLNSWHLETIDHHLSNSTNQKSTKKRSD